MKNGGIFLEINGIGSTTIKEERDFVADYLQRKLYLYKGSNLIAEKTIKKLFKKIK